MHLRLHKKAIITPEQLKIKREAEAKRLEARKELAEAREIAGILREMREKNHFAASFRKALGGNSGS